MLIDNFGFNLKILFSNFFINKILDFKSSQILIIFIRLINVYFSSWKFSCETLTMFLKKPSNVKQSMMIINKTYFKKP